MQNKKSSPSASPKHTLGNLEQYLRDDSESSSAKVTLVKPAQTEEGTAPQSAAGADINPMRAKPKMGRLPSVIAAQFEDADSERTASDDSVTEHALHTRRTDNKFTLLLIVLFIAVNFGLVTLLHSKHQATAAAQTAEPAAIPEATAEPAKKQETVSASSPAPSAAIQPPATAPQVAAPAVVAPAEQPVTEAPVATAPVATPQPAESAAPAAVIAVTPAVPARQETPSDAREINASTPASAEQELLSIISKE